MTLLASFFSHFIDVHRSKCFYLLSPNFLFCDLTYRIICKIYVSHNNVMLSLVTKTNYGLDTFTHHATSQCNCVGTHLPFEELSRGHIGVFPSHKSY